MEASRRSPSCPTSPSYNEDCMVTLVVTGPSSLVRPTSRSSEHSLTDDRLAVPEVTSLDGALSDSELDRQVSVRSTGSRKLASSRRRGKTKDEKRSIAGSSESLSSVTSSQTGHRSTSRISDVSPGKAFGTLSRKRKEHKQPSRRISCKDLGAGQCKGWLLKKKEGVGLKSKKWATRWFVLSRRSLYYYRTEDDEKADGVIYLPGFRISPAPEIKTKKFAFKAHHSGTTFYFAAERQDDMAKWMNKLGLASLGDIELGSVALTAGFWKPGLRPVKSASHLDVSRSDSFTSECYCSESDDSTAGLSGQPSPASSLANSREDISALYRNIRQADLDLAGSNVKEKRSTMLWGAERNESLANNKHDVHWRRLLSLKRTLKDKEQSLAAIEEFLHLAPITAEGLHQFLERHPAIMSSPETELENGQQPSELDGSTLASEDTVEVMSPICRPLSDSALFKESSC